MASYRLIFLIYIVIANSGIGTLYAQITDDPPIPNEDFNLTSIGTNFFVLQWDQDKLIANGNYTVNVTGICAVEHSCDKKVSLCTFTSKKDFGDCTDLVLTLAACQEMIVVVIGDEEEWEIPFNLAPSLDIPILLTHNDNEATMTWVVPASTSSNKCATRARAVLQVGDEWSNITSSFATNLSATNTYNWNLPLCAHGALEATLIYLTQEGEYDTEEVLDPKDPEKYKGAGGVTSVTTISSEPSCSLYSSWEDDCPEEGKTFKVTLDSKEQGVITDKNYTILGLAEKTYTVSVQAYWSDGLETGDNTPGDPIPVPPVAPTAPEKMGVEGSDATPKNLTVTWDQPGSASCAGDITGYTITYSVTEDTSTSTAKADAGTTTYNLTGLLPCKDYTVSMVADWAEGPVEVPGNKNQKTGSTAPAKPSVVIGHVDNASIALSWTQPKADSCPITNYTVNWSPGDGDDGGTHRAGLDLSYTITGVICYEDYTVTVNVIADDEKNTDSEDETIRTEDQAPGETIVNRVIPVEGSSTKLDISWSEPEYSCKGSVETYKVSWTAVDDDIPTGSSETADTFITIDSLIPCTTYTISVAATSNTSLIGPKGENSNTTSVEVPGQITSVINGSITPNSLEVIWSKPSTVSPLGNPCSITKYTVKCTNMPDHEIMDPEQLTDTFTGLDACAKYNITVIAYTKAGDGEPSDPVTMETGTDAPPVDAVEIDSESKSAHLTWDRPPKTDCELVYEVKYTGTTMWEYNNITDSGGLQPIYNQDSTVTADLEELLAYTSYTICVTVRTGNTTCNTTETGKEVPSAPVNVAVEEGSITDVSLTLKWEYPEEENGILQDFVVSWGLEGDSLSNITDTVNANITSLTINELDEGNYIFTVIAVNDEGSSKPSALINQDMNGRTVCGGGCIAGIVISLLLVMGLAITGFIFRDRIKEKIKRGPPPVEESPYELRGAAILKSDFRQHVEELGLDRAERAYQMLNDESQQKPKFAATKPFNKGKNRFANIHPFDETRVKLQLMRNGPKGSDYINANHIIFPDTFTLQFIATQGPLDSTINDYWRMIWEHNVYDVVMLCNLVEKGKSKCAQYWTESGERSMEFGDFKINCQAEEEDESKTFITRYIDIAKDGQHRIVKQHHFLAWPDFGVPENEEGLLRFLASVKQNFNKLGKDVLTHCSAGVGRTGTFIALWVLTSLLDKNKSAKSIDVHKIALMMREGRSDMIQTKDQYLYLHKCLLKYMEVTGNSFPVSNRVSDEEEPIYGNVNTGYQQ